MAQTPARLDLQSGSLTVETTGTILNPWYTLTIIKTWRPDDLLYVDPPIKITPRCRLELGDTRPALHFEDDKITAVFTEKSQQSRPLLNPLLYYITYQTFISYNVTRWPSSEQLDATRHPVVESVPFMRERIVAVETEQTIGGERRKFVHHEGKPEAVTVTATSLRQYLNVLNRSLYYAIAMYLRGCETPAYFLVEYYKAAEAIKNTFKGESDFLDALKPFGVAKNEFKEFTKISNDARLAPLDIGRHAPEPNAQLYTVDLRNVLIHPRSREAVEIATKACRSVINGYIAYLVAQLAS
jgi:hypothetical protein